MKKGLSRLHKLESILLVLLGLGLCLDVPSARAYNEYTSWTETLGQYLFHGFKDLYGIPLPFTLFELLSYGSLLSLFLLWGRQNARFWKVMGAAAILLPLAGAWAWALGAFRGQDLSLALTQFHFIPLVSVWLILGYFMGLRRSNAERIFRVIFWSTLFKALMGLYVFAFIYRFKMGEREFLIDHATSLFLSAGLVYAVWQIVQHKVGLRMKMFYAASFALMGSAYILNDRRASYAGMLVFVLLLPVILPLRLRKQWMPLYKSGLAMGLVVIGAFAMTSNNPYSFSGSFKSELLAGKVLNYRHIENFNLLSGVAESPLLGIGFGRSYPQVIELPDISGTFSLFTAIPHNTLYFLWAFAGPVGIASFVSVIWMVILIITRCGTWARSSSQLFYAVLALMIATQWTLFVFFDMGLLEVRSLMIFGLVIGSLYPQYARHIKEYFDEKFAKESVSDSSPHALTQLRNSEDGQ